MKTAFRIRRNWFTERIAAWHGGKARLGHLGVFKLAVIHLRIKAVSRQ